MVLRARARLVAALAAATAAAQDRPAAGAERWAEVVAALRHQCDEAGVVGASMMFVAGGGEPLFAAYGSADVAAGRSVDRDTIFHWASITKTLTGIAVMQLRDRQRLRLGQPIVDLVPELRGVHDPNRWIGTVTIRHLLSHSAGFRGPTWPWGGEAWHPHEPTEFAQLVAMLPYTRLLFAPGSRYAYSNPGIVFLGRAIERLTGDDYEVYVDKNLLRPLGMHRSYFDVTPYHLQRHRSHSYRRQNGATEDLGPDFDTGITVSNGGLNAPLPDMARYLLFLLGAATGDAAAVLRRESLLEMMQPVLPADGAEQIGLTFFLHDLDGERFWTHTGGQRGFVTFFYVHPASATGALGAFNTASAGPVAHAIRELCMRRLSVPAARR